MKKIEIGDELFAAKTFKLTDTKQRDFYYGLGDNFFIMGLSMTVNKISKQETLNITLNSIDSVFTWCIDDLSELTEFLVTKKELLKIKRKLKLLKLKDI